MDAETHPLPQPFFVIATQKPSNQIGTFPLPESQLDRFLMRMEIGYPDRAAERALLAGADRRAMTAQLQPVMSVADFGMLQRQAGAMHVAPALLDYIQALVESSRRAPQFNSGLSPRAGLGLIAAARAWAFVSGREAVLPEDVQAVLPAVAGHRLKPVQNVSRAAVHELHAEWIRSVAIP
jgi:MoxR-like ATPase